MSIEPYLDAVFDLPGFFIEIGCWDGELLSQTAYLEREKGWKGLCVDPFPRNFGNRTCLVDQRAISQDGKPRKFLKVSIDYGNRGDVSYLSGFDDSVYVHREFIEINCEHVQTYVPTVTFENLCDHYGVPAYVEFLSVDTEGSELEIFKGIDFTKHKFGMIVFEHNENVDMQEAIGLILEVNGYKLFKYLERDDIYINQDLL